MKNVSVFNSTEAEYEEGALFMLDVGSLFSGAFIPPPPRPIFFDGLAKPADLTFCDLCSWAVARSKISTPETSFGNGLDISNKAEWLFSLVIVSIISASLGAIAMIIFFHCKRSKSGIDTRGNVPRESRRHIAMTTDSFDKDQLPPMATSNSPSLPNTTENSVWCWLSKKSPAPIQLDTIASSPKENHYTQMEEPYNNEEALYAELDMESSTGRSNRSDEPYQNQAYADPDVHVLSSAPSSAYYSDLSVTPIPEQAYEIVNLSTMNVNWDNMAGTNRPSVSAKLAAISENVTVPSEYI